MYSTQVRTAESAAHRLGPARLGRSIHPAWIVAAGALVVTIGASAFRSAPGALMVPMHDELGWSVTTMSGAVSINMVLNGLTAPFAATLMQRLGVPGSPVPLWC
jgi:hypothetical protein